MIKRFIIVTLTLLMGVQLSGQRPRIEKFLPDHLNLQFAGGIGFLSTGFGYETNNHRFQGDFYYGYVPESVGGVTIHSVTAKLTWAAITRKVRSDIRIDWLSAGVLVNHVFGKQYFGFDPEYYPYSYYGFPTDTHVGIFLGGSLYKGHWGAYYEVGTTDRDILSYGPNARSLPFNEIFNLAIGVKYSIFHHRWVKSKPPRERGGLQELSIRKS